MAMSIAYECVPLHYKPLIFLQLQCASYAIRDVSFHLQSINMLPHDAQVRYQY